jgi:hypothetical protein
MDLVSADAKTKEIVGVILVIVAEIGIKTWYSLPPVYRQCASVIQIFGMLSRSYPRKTS